MRNKLILLVAGVTLGLMLATNPDRDDLRNFIETRLEEKQQKADDGKKVLMEFLIRPTSWLTNELTNRKNYYFFSLYEIATKNTEIEFNQGKLSAKTSGEPDIIFLGILNQFIILKGKDKIDDLFD